MTRQALLAQMRHPTPDRDGGSSRTLDMAAALGAMGFHVTFCAVEPEDGWERYARLLEQEGTEVRNGVDAVVDDLRRGVFDVAVMTQWRTAERLAPVIVEESEHTAVVVHSSDLHFLRTVRRSIVAGDRIEAEVADEFRRELNSYLLADRVILVSEDEARLLRQLVGEDGRFAVAPLSEPVTEPPLPLSERRGVLFVGNFRHVPNLEAAYYLCEVVLPHVSPGLLLEHPLTVVGNALSEPWYDEVRAAVTGFPGVRVPGWAPDVVPFVRQARVSVAPLLHGAGVKGKILQSLSAGTPVVTTPVGVEGIDPSITALATVASGAFDLAMAIERLLTDDGHWQATAAKAPLSVGERHARPVVVERLRQVIDEAIRAAGRRRVRGGAATGFAAGAHREVERSRQAVAAGFAAAVQAGTPPGSVVLVLSGGKDCAVAIPDRSARHFPEPAGQDGGAGDNGLATVTNLAALIEAGARYLAVPATSLGRLHRCPELAAFLERNGACVTRSEVGLVYELSGSSPP